MPKQAFFNKLRDFFDGLLSKQEEDKVKQWLMDYPDESAKDEALKQVWNQSLDAEDPSLETALARYKESVDNYESRLHHRHVILSVMKKAAVVMLPLLTALVAWYWAVHEMNQNRQLAEFYVPEGKVDSVMLADGSKVYVNGGSTFYYPKHFNKFNDTRDVYISGEAHFNVSHDQKHPFIVHAGDLNIKVLGTQFNVKAYAGQPTITTTLEKGSVRIYDEKMSLLMKPSQQVVYYRENGQFSQAVVDVKDFNYWISGNIGFDQATLKDILKRLSNCYGVKFQVDSSVDLAQKYTISFTSHEKIDDVMEVLVQLSQNLQYNINNNIITLKPSRKEVAP